MECSVSSDEILARYVTSSRWFHQRDLTVKQDAFIPPDSELSVTRHVNFSDGDIWAIGRKIAAGASRTLHGRADVKTFYVINQHLRVEASPVPDNPNHANIVNWPSNKDARKMCALEIAKASRFIPNPDERAQVSVVNTF